MLAVVRTACVRRGARIRAAVGQTVFINMTLMGAVKMPVVQIVDVTFVLDGGMAASWTVCMCVLIVGFVGAHPDGLLFRADVKQA